MGSTLPQSGLPPEVKTVRVILFIIAGFTGLTVVGGIVAFWPLDASEWGLMTYIALPGILALILGLGAAKGGGLRFWVIIALAALTALLALGRLADSPLPALANLLLPGMIIYFITRPRARQHFQGR
jgi:hypothetical protein